jgi:O-antigen ligase
VVAFRDASTGIAILLAMVVVVSRADLWNLSIPFLGGGLKPNDVLIAAVLAGWIVRSCSNKRFDWARMANPVTLSAVLLVTWGAISVLRSTSAGVPFKVCLSEFRPLLSYLLVLPVVSEFDGARIRRVFNVVMLASLGAAGQAVYYYSIGVGEAATSAGALRVRPINFSYLLIVLLAAMASYSTRRLSLVRALGIGGTAAVGMAITLFRSSILGLAAGMAFLAAAAGSQARRRLALFVGLGATLVCGAYVSNSTDGRNLIGGVLDRVKSIPSYRSDVSSTHRLREWAAVMDLVKREPLAGIGLGARVTFYSPEYSNRLRRYGFWSSDLFIHNSYLWAAATMGLVGLLPLLLLLAVPAVCAIGRLSVGDIDPEQRALLLTCSSAMVALAVIAVFGPMLTSLNEAPFVAFATASMWVCSQPASTRRFAGEGGGYS